MTAIKDKHSVQLRTAATITLTRHVATDSHATQSNDREIGGE